MNARIDYAQYASEGIAALARLEEHVRCDSSLEPSLLELVRLRASQLNGCAYCVDMHSKDARSEGESEQRLYALSVWREAPFYSERERAALAWTEAVTRLSAEGVDDELYRSARQEFDEQELVDLTLAVIAINGWNRLSVPFRRQAGTYQPRRQVQAPATEESPGPSASPP